MPLVSSATNLINLFQKCIVLPLTDNSKIASNYYCKRLDQKSFLRCFLLVIAVIVVGIYDFSMKKTVDNAVDNHVDGAEVKGPIKTSQIDPPDISLNDVKISTIK